MTFEKLDFWKFFNHYRKTTTTNRGLEKVNFMTLSGEIREKNQNSVKKTKMKCKSAREVFSIILCVCFVCLNPEKKQEKQIHLTRH